MDKKQMTAVEKFAEYLSFNRPDSIMMKQNGTNINKKLLYGIVISIGKYEFTINVEMSEIPLICSSLFCKGVSYREKFILDFMKKDYIEYIYTEGAKLYDKSQDKITAYEKFNKE